jgi:signal transduction histidine kinase
MWQWFIHGPIRRQIVTLAVLPIFLVGVLGVMTEPPFPEVTELTQAEIIAAQMALVADQVEAAPTAEVSDALLQTARDSGLEVQRSSSFVELGTADTNFHLRLLASLSGVHKRTAWPISGGEGDQLIAVEIRGGLLTFAPVAAPVPAMDDAMVNILLSVVIIVLPVAFLSIYAARLVTGPLTRIAAAAATQKDADPAGEIFDESGPLEIRQLARRLNDMRLQIHTMMNERTAMLRAVSHDLRTPLTRLKLRVERSVPPETSAILMRDITSINDMINETLNYLRSDSETEMPRKTDLPSLLRTICSDFSDIGFAVSYTGPDRLAHICQPKSLARAVSNLADNGTKFGKSVEISVRSLADGSVRIEVADDGPGIPRDLLVKVLEPFVKGDASRGPSSRGGFGLGLSIVHDVVRRHGGVVELFTRAPTGLIVALTLPDSRRET